MASLSEHASSVYREPTHKIIRLPNLIRRLLQPSLRSINTPITLVDILLHITHVIVFKTPFTLLMLRRSLVLCFQPFAMHFWTRAQILLRVREQVVRTCTHEIRPADFRVGYRELSVTCSSGAAD